jgi:hypothetical protein
MRSVGLNSTAFAGTTSRPAAAIANVEPNCSRCGSALRGRLESIHRGPDWTLFVWKCGCGRRRRIKREAAAG